MAHEVGERVLHHEAQAELELSMRPAILRFLHQHDDGLFERPGGRETYPLMLPKSVGVELGNPLERVKAASVAIARVVPHFRQTPEDGHSRAGVNGGEELLEVSDLLLLEQAEEGTLSISEQLHARV